MSSKRKTRKSRSVKGRGPSRSAREVFSSFSSSARKSGNAILRTSGTPDPSSTVGDGVTCTARPSPSPLDALYNTQRFLVEWDNDLPYHLAQHLVRLRRLRGISQAELAQRMGTSQAKIARIEGGEDNVTLRTIQKTAHALAGRLTLSLQPAEMALPQMPRWWEYPTGASQAWGSRPPVFKSMITVQRATGANIAAAWVAKSTDASFEADAPVQAFEGQVQTIEGKSNVTFFEIKEVLELPAGTRFTIEATDDSDASNRT